MSRAENWRLTCDEAAARHRKIVEAYQRGLSSRVVATAFGVSGEMVRDVAKLSGVSRPVGRPRK